MELQEAMCLVMEQRQYINDMAVLKQAVEPLMFLMLFKFLLLLQFFID